MISIAADPIYQNMSEAQLNKLIEETKSRMNKASKNMDFFEAARLRDEMFALQAKVENIKS
jgi:excinuclease ABC subunit B